MREVAGTIRDDNGKFIKGHSGNPSGRPKRAILFRKALENCVTEDEVREVFREVYNKAMLGDMTAAKMFLEYTVGKPKESIEVDGPDGGLTIVVRAKDEG